MPLIPTAEQVSATTVRYDWSGTAPYDVWLRGNLIASQTTVTHLIVEYYDEAAEPWIEVLDATDTDPAQSAVHSPCLRLQWRGQADAGLYLIQQWDGAAWVTKQVLQESGRGYYWTLTTPTADGAVARWRVAVEDYRGYAGAAVLEHEQTMICNPGAPAVTGTYSAITGDLTVADA